MAERKSNDATAMAGEFFVMQSLYRLGHQPALTLGTAKSIDILVKTSSGQLLEVSVKAVRGGGKWGVGKGDLTTRVNLFFVFLYFKDFRDVSRSPAVFVIPASDVERLKEPWLKQYAVYFANRKQRERLESYKDAWANYFV
jgi:hypothetical protein